MSYFDTDNYTGGDGSDNDEEKKSENSDAETVVSDDDIVEQVSDDEDEEIKGIASDEDEDEEEDVEGKSGRKIDYLKEHDADFGSDDDEGLNAYAKRRGTEIRSEKDNGSENDSDEESVAPKKKTKKLPAPKQKAPAFIDEEDDEDPSGEVYLQKFDKEINDNYLVNFHPESAVHNYDEILAMTKVVRDKFGIIVDDLHKTIPYLTKYEKARVLGLRAKQINSGASVFVKVPEKVIDGYLIAELELLEKRIPFIIRRPMPNGGSEYWSIKELENISF